MIKVENGTCKMAGLPYDDIKSNSEETDKLIREVGVLESEIFISFSGRREE